MIFKTILSVKCKPEFELLTYLVILSFIASLAGCATTESLRVKSDYTSHNMNYEIAEVEMNDGTVINLRGKSPHYYEDWEDKKNVILYTNDTVWTSEKRYTISNETKAIELDNARWITLERDEKEVEVTVTTKNYIKHKGILLSVTDEKISLYNKKARNNVTVIEKDSVGRVLIYGDDKRFESIGFGALIGAGAGTLIMLLLNSSCSFLSIKYNISEETIVLLTASIGALAGGLIGMMVGSSNSIPDKTIWIFSDDDYLKLMRYIKYPSCEP